MQGLTHHLGSCQTLEDETPAVLQQWKSRQATKAGTMSALQRQKRQRVTDANTHVGWI